MLRTPFPERDSASARITPFGSINQGSDGNASLSVIEASKIIEKIRPVFSIFLGQYDTKKYSPDVYSRILKAFSHDRNVPRDVLRDALFWKYGHLGKDNIPGTQKRLIAEVQHEWSGLILRLSDQPEQAFRILNGAIGGKTRYITVAFLTHLLFPQIIPIIDQHNFRAVNSLMSAVRPGWQIRKTPSRYEDIITLDQFMLQVLVAWEAQFIHDCPTLRDLDKFLMMYGKALKLRLRSSIKETKVTPRLA